MQSNKLMLIIAIVAGVVATVMAFTYISSATKAAETGPEEAQVSIVLALANLPANKVLNPDTDLTTANFGVSSNAGMINAAVKADELESLRGRRINDPIPAGMPVLYAHLAGIMDIELAPASRAMGITVSDEAILGGILVPGDRVDIMVTYQKKEEMPAMDSADVPAFDINNPAALIGAVMNQGMQQSMAPSSWEVEEILQNIRVIAIGDRLGKSRQQHVYSRESGMEDFMGGASPVNILTLEVTIEQSKQLIKAMAGGKNNVHLLLRPGSPGVITRDDSVIEEEG